MYKDSTLIQSDDSNLEEIFSNRMSQQNKTRQSGYFTTSVWIIKTQSIHSVKNKIYNAAFAF